MNAGWVAIAAIVASISTTACRERANESAGEAGASTAKKEEYCKLLETQFAAMSKELASGDFADPAKRRVYFTEQKAMNAKILAAAPAAIRSDTELQVKNANAVYDAQIAGDREKSSAASAVLSSKENLDASKRMRDYCGIKTPG